jgi:hypothetical protein
VRCTSRVDDSFKVSQRYRLKQFIKSGATHL